MKKSVWQKQVPTAADASEHWNKQPFNKFEKKKKKHEANIYHIKFSLIEKRGGLRKFKNENQP